MYFYYFTKNKLKKTSDENQNDTKKYLFSQKYILKFYVYDKTYITSYYL